MIRLANDAMPKLGAEVKDLVSDGVWALYSLRDDPDHYLLVESKSWCCGGSGHTWLLATDGTVVTATPPNVDRVDLVIFDRDPGDARSRVVIQN